MSASEQAAWFMVAAARGHGSQALAPPGDAGMAASEAALGRDLLRLFFGDSVPGRELPALVAAVIASPRGGEALTALDVYLDEALEQDAELAAAVEEMLARFFREQLESGDGQTLAELGNLSWRDCHLMEGAAVSFSQASDRAGPRELAGGQQVRAPVVIAAIDPRQTFGTLLSPGQVPARYLAKLRRMEAARPWQDSCPAGTFVTRRWTFVPGLRE